MIDPDIPPEPRRSAVARESRYRTRARTRTFARAHMHAVATLKHINCNPLPPMARLVVFFAALELAHFEFAARRHELRAQRAPGRRCPRPMWRIAQAPSFEFLAIACSRKLTCARARMPRAHHHEDVSLLSAQPKRGTFRSILTP